MCDTAQRMASGGAQQILLVGAGGFLGSVLRYGMYGLVSRLPLAAFPYGTLAANLLGCLAIGLLAGLAESRNLIGPDMRLFLFVGLLGGFTTYSAFGYEIFALLRDGEHLRSAAFVLAHLLVGVGAVWLGYALTSQPS